jgi:hypothetical protein
MDPSSITSSASISKVGAGSQFASSSGSAFNALSARPASLFAGFARLCDTGVHDMIPESNQTSTL